MPDEPKHAGGKRVAYFTSFGFVQKPNGDISSDIASVRYRVLLPGPYLAELGWDIEICTLTEAHLQDPQATAQAVQADVALIAKVVDVRAVNVVAALKARGVRVIADFCDNHFQHPELGALYRGLVWAADRTTANSPTMAELIGGLTGRTSEVVFDPVEGRKNAPRFARSSPAMKLVWYGFPTGLPYLFRRLVHWHREGLPFPIAVDIVTEPSAELQHSIASYNRTFGAQCLLRAVPWSTEAEWDAVENTDAVLIPSELNDLTRTKSANRLTEAIHGGRLAFATMLPSYREFEPFCFSVESVNTLALAAQDPDAVCRKIQAGQDYIEQRYLPRHAALIWDRLFRTMCA